MKKLFEPKSGVLTLRYEPNEQTKLLENPPRFTWIAARLEDDHYVMQLSVSAEFETNLTETFHSIPYNLYTPDHPLAAGTYYWRYALLDTDDHGERQQTDWSQVRSFTVPEGLPCTALPSRADRFQATDHAHPRLWLNAEEIVKFREQLDDEDYCGWTTFYEGSVKRWMELEPIPEPERYPDNKRVAKLWRQMYIDCQEALYAIRHLSVAGMILQDQAIIEHAKRWLLHVVEWDTDGTTSRDYNDEASFRIAGAIAWGYDWLHDQLTAEEQVTVRACLMRRTQQVAVHVIERSRIHQVPFDSHAVRSLSSVLVPACIAMLHEEPKAREWLDYTLEYYACLYSPWGGEDGGWAEGPLYWTTGMAYVIDALHLIKKYCSIDLFQRPFFSHTGDFPLYCCSPDTTRASFGDQSFLGEPVSLKTGYNIRHFAGVTGNGLYQWYYEQVKKTDTDPDSKYYNYGWWDFRFDDMVFRHDYTQVEAVLPENNRINSIKWFRDIGWVAMHHRMDDPAEHIMLLTKSSPYGSISHSHGDQNGFLLHAYGEPLAIESGYYVAFGSTMHMNWRRQTRSTNGLLIDGKGQYAGTNKVLCMSASGYIEEVRSTPDCGYSRCNATAAYKEHVPYLEQYVREFYFLNQSYVVIVDYVDLSQPASIEWLMHTLHPMKLSGQSFQVGGEKADLSGRFVYSSSGSLSLSQHNTFTDVDPVDLEGLPPQWHLHAKSRQASSHRLVTLLTPMKKGDASYVSYFLDDQGYDVFIYFTNEHGATQRVDVKKAY
jgi:hypothetical protein